MSVDNVSKYRFVVLTMCVTAAFLDYATRTNINNAIVSMVHTSLNSAKNSFVSDYCPIPERHSMLTPNGSIEHAHLDETFDWDPTTQGAILGAFFYGYIILQIPAGRMAEIFGGKWIVFIGIFGSGIINLLTPVLAKSVGLLIASRVVLGLVQGGVYPAMFTLINVLLKPEEKSIGIGLCHVGGNLGSVAAATLTGYMSQHVGWKSSFYTLGAIGVVWTAVWHFVVDDVKNPNAHVKSESEDNQSDAENVGAKIVDPDGEEKLKEMKELSPSLLNVPWMKILKNIPVIACIFGRFGASLAYLTLQTKLPGYLKDILHIEPSMNGLLNALLYASTCLSMIGGSYLSEIFIKRAWLSRTNTRKAFTGVGLLVCCICFCIVPSAGCNTILIMILLVISISSYGLTAGGDMIVPAEMSRMYPSTIYSLCNTWANVAGTVTPIAIGSVLNQATDGSSLKRQWDMVFYSVAVIVTITTLVYVGWTSAEYQDDIDYCYRKRDGVKIAEKGDSIKIAEKRDRTGSAKSRDGRNNGIHNGQLKN